jgi:uncharacterized membrane protein
MDNLERPIIEGYTLNPTAYLKKAWSSFNQEAGTFIGMTLLFFVLQYALSLIPFLSLLSNFITSCFTAGYYIYLRNMENDSHQAKQFFDGFLYFKDIFLYLLTFLLLLAPVLVLIILIASPSIEFISDFTAAFGSNNPATALENIEFPNMPISFSIGLFILALLAIYLSVSYLFVLPLIVDGKQSFWTAMELSRQTVSQRFFEILAYLIVAIVAFFLVSIVTCFVGVLVASPLLYCLTFEAYKDIFDPYGEKEKEAENDLLES